MRSPSGVGEWKKLLFATVALLLGLAVPYLVAEGVYSLASGGRAQTSLTYRIFSDWRSRLVARAVAPDDPTARMLTDLREIESRIGLLVEQGVGMGNNPFDALKDNRSAAINSEADGCLVQKPNLRKTASFLRSNLFNPFDQITYFYDEGKNLPPDLQSLFDRYGFRAVRLSSNEYGERRTTPVVESAHKVLIAGDSVAHGAMLDDTETLASQMQARDPARQYVNLGIIGAKAADTVCALERAAKRYSGEIDRLIYVFCENDFDPSEPYGTPEELIAWLDGFRRRERVGEVVLLYSPYIYNAVPEVTRVRGHSHYTFPSYVDEKRRLLSLSREAGFSVVDFNQIVTERLAVVGSQFAPLALYVDHTHFSRFGVELLVDRFPDELGLPAHRLPIEPSS